MAARKRTLTASEVKAAFPNVTVLKVPDAFFAKLPAESPSVWLCLYNWLEKEHGIDQTTRLDLHNRTAAGKDLMKKLVAAEKKRLRKKLGISGEKLETAVNWSNVGSGPHGMVGGRTLHGSELVVFPEGDEDPANVRL